MKIYKVYRRICLGNHSFCQNCEEKEILENFAYNASIETGLGVCRKTAKIVKYKYELVEDRTKSSIF